MKRTLEEKLNTNIFVSEHRIIKLDNIDDFQFEDIQIYKFNETFNLFPTKFRNIINNNNVTK
jgi:hypothetical protein